MMADSTLSMLEIPGSVVICVTFRTIQPLCRPLVNIHAPPCLSKAMNSLRCWVCCHSFVNRLKDGCRLFHLRQESMDNTPTHTPASADDTMPRTGNTMVVCVRGGEARHKQTFRASADK